MVPGHCPVLPPTRSVTHGQLHLKKQRRGYCHDRAVVAPELGEGRVVLVDACCSLPPSPGAHSARSQANAAPMPCTATHRSRVAKILSLWRRAGTAGHRFVGCARSTNGCQLAPSSDLQARSNYDGDPLAARSARTYNTMHVHSRHPLLLLLLLLRMIRRATPPRPPPRSPAQRSWRCAAGSGSGSCPTQRTKTSSETSPSRGR